MQKGFLHPDERNDSVDLSMTEAEARRLKKLGGKCRAAEESPLQKRARRVRAAKEEADHLALREAAAQRRCVEAAEREMLQASEQERPQAVERERWLAAARERMQLETLTRHEAEERAKRDAERGTEVRRQVVLKEARRPHREKESVAREKTMAEAAAPAKCVRVLPHFLCVCS